MAVDITNKFIVHWQEYLKDGVEEGSQVVTGIDAAVRLVNEIKDSFFGENTTCFVFKVGEHVPLVTEKVEEPQPAKVTTRYKVAGGGDA